MNESNSPSDEQNQENSSGLLDEAMREKDTLPPTANGNPTWLDQFELFGMSALADLKSVAEQGLQEAEVDVLIYAAAQLLKAALAHEPKALERAEALVHL